MTSPLIIDNEPYISAAGASHAASLSRDYIAGLAKDGQLRGRMVAHTWFIEFRSLQSFLAARAPARGHQRGYSSDLDRSITIVRG